MLEPGWLRLSLETQSINTIRYYVLLCSLFSKSSFSGLTCHITSLTCFKGHLLPCDLNFPPYPWLINNIFIIFPESADFLNKMDYLTHIFVSIVRHSPSQISVKMCPKFHMIHGMSQTRTTPITVPLRACLPKSCKFSTWCHLRKTWCHISCVKVPFWTLRYNHFPPLCYDFLGAC